MVGKTCQSVVHLLVIVLREGFEFIWWAGHCCQMSVLVASMLSASSVLAAWNG